LRSVRGSVGVDNRTLSSSAERPSHHPHRNTLARLG
jgi:hypothetical protein